MTYALTDAEFSARIAAYNRNAGQSTEPHSTQPCSRDYLMAHLRAARTRAQLSVHEIDEIGVALKSNIIDTREALEWLEDVNALRFLMDPGEAAA